jgi:hypothetical protein
VTCRVAVANALPGSENWIMGRFGTLLAGGDGTSAVTWRYDLSGTYTISVTVSGLSGGTASDSTQVAV